MTWKTYEMMAGGIIADFGELFRGAVMLELEYSTQFKKDFKKVAKMQIPDAVEIGYVIKQLQLKNELPEKYADHALSGNWQEYRDCHVKPDLVLIYKTEANTLKLARIGSHSELFR